MKFCTFSFPDSKGQNFWILDTDYDNFSLAYICKNYFGGLFHSKTGWIYGRSHVMDSAILKQSCATFSEVAGIDEKAFLMTDQSNCESKPEPERL